MMDPATAYFLKKYYPHVIKWWLVVYNPEVFRVWPSKTEEKEALRLEAENAKLLALEAQNNESECTDNITNDDIDESAFNASTGSYSGLYGQKPVDAATQSALDAIMNISSNQNNIDYLLSGGAPGAAYESDQPKASYTKDSYDDIFIPPEQEEIINEANAIYERLLREAAEDEAKKQAEIEKAREEYDNN